MIEPRTLLDKFPGEALLRRPPDLLCTQLVAMAHQGFDTTTLIGMQDTAFASAAQYVLHADAKGVSVNDARMESLLSQYVGPTGAHPITADIVAAYMSSAKLQHQIGARQLLADAADMAHIAIQADSSAALLRDGWVRGSLDRLMEHAGGASATMPMFASEQRLAVDRLVSHYPALAPALDNQERDADDEEEAGDYAPR
jgi:hypothetical protein